MGLIGIILLALILIASTILPVFYVYRNGSKMRRKGYSPLEAVGISFITLALSSFIVFIVCNMLIEEIGLTLLISYLASVITLSVVRKILPVKRHDVYGIRTTKISYHSLGIALQIASVSGALLFLINYKAFENNYSGLLIFLTCMYALFVNSYRIKYFDKLFKRQKDENEIGVNTGEFVLYTRSFILDNNYFAGVRMKKVRHELGDIFEVQFSKMVFDPVIYLTFQKYFMFQVKKQLGDFFALSNPNDLLPIEGTTSVYLDSAVWQKKYVVYLSRARCIIVQCSISTHIGFEMGEILKFGYAQKTFILLSPREKNFFVRRIQPLNNWMKDSEIVSWKRFETLLNKVGYKSSIKPKGGAVITFDEDNNAIILKEGCKTPSEYIDVVKDYLAH